MEKDDEVVFLLRTGRTGRKAGVVVEAELKGRYCVGADTERVLPNRTDRAVLDPEARRLALLLGCAAGTWCESNEEPLAGG